jgi:uncharacterized protein
MVSWSKSSSPPWAADGAAAGVVTFGILLLRLYRAVLSPWLGPRCRFHPSCSRYAEDALAGHGLFRGGRLAVTRIMRCHPWHPGGYDPVPGTRQ